MRITVKSAKRSGDDDGHRLKRLSRNLNSNEHTVQERQWCSRKFGVEDGEAVLTARGNFCEFCYCSQCNLILQ